MAIEKPATSTNDDDNDVMIIDEPSADSGDTTDPEKGNSASTEDKTGEFEDYLLSDDSQGTKEPNKTTQSVDFESDANPYKKRYSDSSREAQRLAQAEKDLNELLETIKSDAELAERVKAAARNVDFDSLSKSKETSQQDNGQVQQLMSEVANLKQTIDEGQRKVNTTIVKSFEDRIRKSGRVVTVADRNAMKPIVTALLTAKNPLTLQEALEVAWIRVNKDTVVKDAKEEGKKQGLAQAKQNIAATSSTQNTAKHNGSGLYLTQKELEAAHKMGIRSKEELKRFATKLRQIRS